jgi:hypothetical protein
MVTPPVDIAPWIPTSQAGHKCWREEGSACCRENAALATETSVDDCRKSAATLIVVTDLEIVDVSDWEVRFPEPGGGDANIWLIDPRTDGLCALFKPVVAKAGRRQGEDWAEKAVEQIASLLSIPSALIRMATRRGQAGLLSYDLAPVGSELQTGAVLIGEIDDRLVPRAWERLGHNLDNIFQVLSPLSAVEMPDKFTAYDQFCGYLILDALVANRDRHEENWGVLRDLEGRVTLAPSYDHGNSLGFNLTDAFRARELERDPDLAKWASRGLADRFEGCREVTLVDFARRALERSSPGTVDHWRDDSRRSRPPTGKRSSAGHPKCQRSVVGSVYDC